MIGASFIANGPYFMTSAGMSPTRTAMMIELGIGFGIISSVATFVAMSRFDRKLIIIFGVALAAILFLMIGIADYFSSSSTALW
jgi:MFS transporter, SP family, general alpha glucoside:H+ symporter